MTKKNWEQPICNLCNAKENKPFCTDITYWEYQGVFQEVQCISCQLVFLSPRPKIDEIKKYYGGVEYFAIDNENVAEENKELIERDKRYGNIYKLILAKKNKGKILDIGAGTGLFLSKFKELGWQVEGMELNPGGVRFAKKNYGITLHNGEFFSVPLEKEQFDTITLNGVLEHVYDPVATLTRVHSLLKKDGVLLLSVPNVDSIGRILFGKQWFAWLAPTHLYTFSPKTVSGVLAKAGFKKSRISHDYYLQNFYILFQSLRYAKSPRFKKKDSGGLAVAPEEYKGTFSLKKELGKIAGNIFAFVISSLEPLLQRGEVLVVVAKK